MKRKKAKVFSLFLCLVMVSSILAGCKNRKSTKEVSDLSWYINFSWFTPQWGNNMVSKAITDKTGCNIDFVVPTGNPNEKLDSMIASDSLPDLITLGWWEPEISQMINQKKVYALDELADKYDTYFYNVVNKEVVKWHTSNDGHLYGYPNSACSPSDYKKYKNLASNETFLVRKDIYEAIGSPDMTTPDSFVAAVEKAAKMFPTIDGNELIPVGCTEFNDVGCDSFDNYLMDFLAVPYVDKKGNAIDRIRNKDYVAWLKAYNKLGREGLLKDEIFLDSRTQMSEKIGKGQYFCMIYQYTDLADQEKALYAKNPNSIYIAVDGPKNLKGDDYTLPGTSINGWTVTMVSKNCKNPEKAIKLITYLLGEEGQKMTWLGVKGKMWDYNSDGVPEIKQKIKDVLYTDRTTYDKKYGADSCYWMLQNDAMASEWIRDDNNNPLTQLKQWTYPYTTYVGQYTITFDSDSKIGSIKSKIDKSWSDTLPKLLLAKNDSEFNKIYNKHISYRDKIGYNKVKTALTKLIKENKKKLGLDE